MPSRRALHAGATLPWVCRHELSFQNSGRHSLSVARALGTQYAVYAFGKSEYMQQSTHNFVRHLTSVRLRWCAIICLVLAFSSQAEL